MCFWNGWPRATICEKDGKAMMKEVSEVLNTSSSVRIWSFLEMAFYCFTSAALSYSSISLWGSGCILVQCLHFCFRVSLLALSSSVSPQFFFAILTTRQ